MFSGNKKNKKCQPDYEQNVLVLTVRKVSKSIQSVVSNTRFRDHDVLPSICCTTLPEWVDYFYVSHSFLKESILSCRGEQLAQTDVAGSSQLGRVGLFLLGLAVLTNGSQKL